VDAKLDECIAQIMKHVVGEIAIDSDKSESFIPSSLEYDFVRISPEHYGDFQVLVEDSFGSTPSREEVAHLFDTGGYGASHIGFLAYHRATREPAAFYGVFPCFVELDGRRILAAQSGSTMTHSNHRRRNLFYLAGRKTFDLAASEGIAFIFGFPNRDSYRGLLKLGWTHDGDMARYRIFVPTIPLGFLAPFSGMVRDLHGRVLARVVKKWRIDAFPITSSALEPGVGGMHRSQLSLNYKPEDDRHMLLRVGESVVWINQIDGQIGIGDMQISARKGEFRRVLQTVKWIAFLSGCSVVRTYVSPQSRLDRLFRDHGYKSSTALANCYLDLTGEADPSLFKWVYGDFDTY
jgi:hypothetical protein